MDIKNTRLTIISERSQISEAHSRVDDETDNVDNDVLINENFLASSLLIGSDRLSSTTPLFESGSTLPLNNQVQTARLATWVEGARQRP